MRLTRRCRLQTCLPAAAMADVTFLLSFFLVLAMVQEPDRTSVDLPVAGFRVDAERGAALVVLAKTTDVHGVEGLVYRFSDGASMSRPVESTQSILFEASRLIRDAPTRQFIVKAEGAVRYERIDELLDLLRQGGVRRVLLLAAQRKDGTSR